MKGTQFNTAATYGCNFMRAFWSYILGQYQITLLFVKNTVMKKTTLMYYNGGL
jgi:hypothetical protein